MNLPEKITTVRVKTKLENAQIVSRRLIDAVNHASTMNTLDLYDALLGSDTLELGRVILKIDRAFAEDYEAHLFDLNNNLRV